MGVAPAAKYINLNYEFRDWRNDHWVDPKAQWTHCMLDLVPGIHLLPNPNLGTLKQLNHIRFYVAELASTVTGNVVSVRTFLHCLAIICPLLGLEPPSLQSPDFVIENKIHQWGTENDGKAYFHSLVPRTMYPSSWGYNTIWEPSFINTLWPEW